MKVIVRLVLGLLFVVSGAPSLWAYGSYVSGVIYKDTSAPGSQNAPAAGFNISLCPTSQGVVGPFPGCHGAITDAFGNFNMTLGALQGGNWWVFAWKDSESWGSQTQSVGCCSVPIFEDPFVINAPSSVSASSRPRPKKPTAVYPANGTTTAPTTFDLQWTDGLDPERTNSAWPVTYDIYTSAAGGPVALTMADVPCGGSGNGVCSLRIEGLQTSTDYTWKVVAKMNTQVGAPGSQFYTASSPTFSLRTRSSRYRGV